MSLPGYIEAHLSDHKPVYVEMRRTDKRAHAALPDRSLPKSGGEEYLETAGRKAMLGPDDMAVDENAGDAGDAHAADVVRLVTMNVAGLCDDLRPAGARMDEILTKLLADENPDVLCFQEVTDEMYRERTARTFIFDTEPLCGPEPWPMVLNHLTRLQAGSLAFSLPTLIHND